MRRISSLPKQMTITPTRAHACSRHCFHCIDLLFLEIRGLPIFTSFFSNGPAHQSLACPSCDCLPLLVHEIMVITLTQACCPFDGPLRMQAPITWGPAKQQSFDALKVVLHVWLRPGAAGSPPRRCLGAGSVDHPEAA